MSPSAGRRFVLRFPQPQCFGVEGDVRADVASDGVVTVVVAGVQVVIHAVARLPGGVHEGFAADFAWAEFVGVARVNADGQVLRAGGGEQRGAVPIAPGVLVIAEVGGEGFLSPRGVARVDDGREGRYGGVARGVFRAICSAPCPPMLCPAIPARSSSG